ncbi:MAG: zinc ribbon domain-containing protein [Methanomassiliicoccus sp.]|nr:zinc ribbon domain-containing protein [Methanomassiliicoccus sp.]
MRCENCGNENAEGVTFCMACGARMVPVSDTAPAAPVAPPGGQAAPPHVPPYPAQLFRPPRVATVRNVHLGDVLFLISSALLLVAGFDNFASLSYLARAQYVLLGLFAIVGGLLFLGMIIMPHLLKPIAHMMDLIVLGLSAIFLFWGVAAMFGSSIGYDGGMVFVGGLFGLAGMALRMGIIR